MQWISFGNFGQQLDFVTSCLRVAASGFDDFESRMSFLSNYTVNSNVPRSAQEKITDCECFTSQTVEKWPHLYIQWHAIRKCSKTWESVDSPKLSYHRVSIILEDIIDLDWKISASIVVSRRLCEVE